ncbi:hypothetical protein ACMD2_15584 [Ananas comosus]|uniref:Uncharacterized protein n=1 Tax=Ananas comosus TaxID=4615 RepID=A0A199W8R9_ANACO|nr:hypothetical protein ACMD2_15584 [Ananas comosus]
MTRFNASGEISTVMKIRAVGLELRRQPTVDHGAPPRLPQELPHHNSRERKQ